MNKLLIVLLAVCLFSVVSAHTFVKRDAPATDDIKTQLDTLKDKIIEGGNNLGKTIADALNPEVLKKNINDFIDAGTKAVNSVQEKLKPAEGAKPAAQ